MKEVRSLRMIAGYSCEVMKQGKANRGKIVKHRHEDEAKDSFNENRYVELHKQNLVNL
jgi:hypothetical protein